jgi:hypothetical protein
MLKILNPEVDSLLREVMAHGNCLRGKSLGRSMLPLVHSDDHVFIEYKGIDSLNIGDVVFFRNHLGTYVIHRLIRKQGSAAIITRGDNVPRFDVPVPADNILGRVTQIESHGKRLKLTGGLSRIFAYFIALFGRARFRGQVRITRRINKLWWTIEGRRIK